MSTLLPKARRELLVEMEKILASECYNAKTENHGPGGVRLAPGRSYRYPITLRSEDGEKTQVRGRIPPSVSDSMVRGGYYAFGTNQLDVMSGMEKILQLLEARYGFHLPDEPPADAQS